MKNNKIYGALKASQNQIYILEKEENTIGRANNCDIIINVIFIYFLIFIFLI